MLIFELYALALRDPASFPGILDEPAAYWTRLLDRVGIPATRGGGVTATLLVAATRGFLLDFAATGDRARLSLAVGRLAKLVSRGGTGRHRRVSPARRRGAHASG
jgi:hypothetical protein